jgi:hypothetical protein
MRLVLTVRGTDVLELELRWPGTPESEPPGLEASSGGDFERAEPYGDPATQHCFGFQARRGDDDG